MTRPSTRGDAKLLTAFPTEYCRGAGAQISRVIEGPISLASLCGHAFAGAWFRPCRVWARAVYELSAFITDCYREKGVEVLAGASVTGMGRTGGIARVSPEDGRMLETDVILAGLGPSLPPPPDCRSRMGSSSMSADASADVRTCSRQVTSPAPPAASLVNAMGVEHEGHAKSHGRLTGIDMAGADEAYEHLPFFYSDVGVLAPRHETLGQWEEPNRKGVVYYLDAEQHPRGVLLWSVSGRVGAARDLICAHRPIDASWLSEPGG